MKRAIVLLVCITLTGCSGFWKAPTTTTTGGTSTSGTPRFLYVADFSGGFAGSVSAFTVNSSSGSLTSTTGSPFTAAVGSSALGADSNGTYLYVSAQGGGVNGYIINRNDGTLGLINGGTPFATDNTPVSIAVDPQARFVYVANSGSKDLNGYTIASGSGVLTALSATISLAATPIQVRIDPAGRFVYVTESGAGTQVFKVNSDGTLTSVATVPIAPCASASDIAFDPTSKFAYIADGNSSVCPYTINASTGNLISIGTTAVTVGSGPVNAFVSPIGGVLAVANKKSNNVSMFAIAADGTLTAASGSPVSVGNAPVAVTIDPSGKFLYVANSTDNTLTLFNMSSAGVLSNGTTIPEGQQPTAIVVTK